MAVEGTELVRNPGVQHMQVLNSTAVTWFGTGKITVADFAPICPGWFGARAMR